MCLRCSPGLFRHSCGAVSCHTSSMAANPHLALTKNSSPTTLANGRRVAQNRGVQRQRPGRPAHGAKSPIVPSAIRRWRYPRPMAMVHADAPVGWTAWTINHRHTGYRPPAYRGECVPCYTAGASPRPTVWNPSACGNWPVTAGGGTHRSRPTNIQKTAAGISGGGSLYQI